MTIAIQHALTVSLKFPGIAEIGPEDLFKLTNILDAYEVEASVSDKIVVDITEICNDGTINLLLTLKTCQTYEQVYDHINDIVAHAADRSGLDLGMFKIMKITTNMKKTGIPSNLGPNESWDEPLN